MPVPDFSTVPDRPAAPRRLAPLLAALALVSVLAAGVAWRASPRRPAGPSPVRVSGTVSLDGRPLPDGDVAFDGNDGSPPVHAAVIDGRFTLAIVPGEKRVLVNRYQPSGEQDPYGQPVQVSTIPPRYNAATELKAVVTPTGPNEIELLLRSR